MSPDGTVLGYLHAIPQPRATSPQEVEDAMAAGACLAELAIDTRRLYTDLRRRSEFDLLTDVPNRFSMERKLDQLMLAARSSREAFGLIYVDLDRFKDVNDQYGHRIGDLYLTEVTRRMKLQLRSHDFLARIGGDEFIALAPVADGRADAEEIAVRLQRSFDEPFFIEGIQIFGGASVGLAIYPEDGTNEEDLQKVADAAMYADKESKRPNRLGQSRVILESPFPLPLRHAGCVPAIRSFSWQARESTPERAAHPRCSDRTSSRSLPSRRAAVWAC